MVSSGLGRRRLERQWTGRWWPDSTPVYIWTSKQEKQRKRRVLNRGGKSGYKSWRQSTNMTYSSDTTGLVQSQKGLNVNIWGLSIPEEGPSLSLQHGLNSMMLTQMLREKSLVLRQLFWLWMCSALQAVNSWRPWAVPPSHILWRHTLQCIVRGGT